MTEYRWDKMSVQEIGAAICDRLRKNGIPVVLSGGACVSIYSKNRYVSRDLDFVMPDYSLSSLDPLMMQLGFHRVPSGRYYENKDCPLSVEFPPSPLTVGREFVKKTKILRNKYGQLRLLRPVDSVKDRLAAFYHWKDRQSLEQAVMICRAQRVNMKEIKRWSREEGASEEFKIFVRGLESE